MHNNWISLPPHTKLAGVWSGHETTFILMALKSSCTRPFSYKTRIFAAAACALVLVALFRHGSDVGVADWPQRTTRSYRVEHHRSNISLSTVRAYKAPCVEQQLGAGVGKRCAPAIVPQEGFKLLPWKIVEAVERFVFFLGWPRSGHSIIASMMDAHPEMIIAQHFLLFKELPNEASKQLLINNDKRLVKTKFFSELYHDSHYSANHYRKNGTKGYNLSLDTRWQGTFNKLRVIGTREGGYVSSRYSEDPLLLGLYYQILVDKLSIPVHVLLVVRNPYDMIATSLLYNVSSTCKKRVCASKENPYNDPPRLMQQAELIFRDAAAVEAMIRDCHLNVLRIHHEDHVKEPVRTMQQICNFLDVQCAKDFLRQCDRKTFKVFSNTRETVVWTKEVLDFVERNIRRYSFFSRYSEFD